MASLQIIVCTRNRTASLKRTILTIQRSRVPKDCRAEILVVDNSPSGGAGPIVDEIHDKPIGMRYVHEESGGLSRARNRGLLNAQGDIILFTDDDVLVPENWIEAMTRPIIQGKAELVAGAVRLSRSIQRDWMTVQHRGWLASTEIYEAGHKPSLTGASMSFARSVLAEVPGFDVSLGAGALGCEEESLFGRQLVARGYRIVFQNDAAVEHDPDPKRLARSSFLAQAKGRGQSAAYVDYHWNRVPLDMTLCRLLASAFRLFYWRLRFLHETRREEGCAVDEMNLVRSYYYYRQLLRERNNPRKYCSLIRIGVTQAS